MADLTQSSPRVAWQRLRTPWTLVVLIPLAVALLDPDRFADVTAFAVQAFVRTLPFIAFAVALIAISRRRVGRR